MPQVFADKHTNRLGNQRLHLLSRHHQAIPEILRPFSAPPHCQQRIIVVDDGLGNDQWVGVGEEAINNTLYSHHLGGELRRSFGISIEPSLNEFDLVAEVEGGRAEGR